MTVHTSSGRLDYLRAYAQVLFRTVPWVTLMCVLLFVLFVSVPQAGELILSQATRPAANESSGGFYWRLLGVNFGALVLAFSLWLSARVLVHNEPKTYLHENIHGPERQAARYVPRLLGLSVFFTLQMAAAGSLSQQGYSLPMALAFLWFVLLAMGLLRMTPEIRGQDLQMWWWLLLAVGLVVATMAFFDDRQWLRHRAGGGLPVEWMREQRHALNLMGGIAISVTVLLLAATTPAITRGTRSAWAQGVATALALGAIGGALYATRLLTGQDMYWLFFLTQSLMALVFWLLVSRRRDMAAYIATRGWCAPLRKMTNDNVRGVVAGFIVAATGLLMAWASYDPIAMGSHFGAMGIILMFLAFFVLVVALFQAWLGSREWGRALPAGTVALVALFFLFAKATPPEPPRGDAFVPLKTIEHDLAKLPDEGPLFAIAAHGGGIRAAQYTAAFAAWFDHETDYQFSRRLVAASGASGGSVGLAVWSAATAAGCREKPPIRSESGEKIPACVQAVNDTLAQDHLGPLIATGLFRDYLLFWLAPQRGNTLQQSILWAALKVPKEPFHDSMEDSLRSGLPRAEFPLLLNSAYVGTAQPYALVTRKNMLPPESDEKGEATTFVASGDSDSVSLLTAAMHSARFPLISPKGLVAAAGPAVVDGGYFDNSGVAVLRQYLMRWAGRRSPATDALRERLVIVSLDSEPISATAPLEAGDGRNSFGEIVATLLAARGWNGMAAWHQLCTEFPGARLFSARPGAPLWAYQQADHPGRGGVRCNWPSESTPAVKGGKQVLWQRQMETQAPALGWHLSRRSALRVSNDAKEKAENLALQLQMSRGVMTVTGDAIQRTAPGEAAAAAAAAAARK